MSYKTLLIPGTEPSPWLHRGLSIVGNLFKVDMTQMGVQGIKVVLSLLIMTILTALAGGVFLTFLELHLLLSNPLEVALRQVIVNTLLLLAIVEVFKTTLTYLSEGRVKVTFIVDTILIVMLTEVISLWFKEALPEKWVILGGILLSLGIIRIAVVRWSPTKCDGASDSLRPETSLS